MKRFRLATKLAMAILPIGLVALATGALASWSFLEEARSEERVAFAGAVAVDAMNALIRVSSEQSHTLNAALGNPTANLDTARTATDAALGELRESVRVLVPAASGSASGIAARIVSDSSLVVARLEDLRAGDPLSDETTELIDEIGARLISIVNQSTLYFGEEGRAREGAAASALARGSFVAVQQERLFFRYQGNPDLLTTEEFERQFLALETTVVDWLFTARDSSPTVSALGIARTLPLDEGVIPDAEDYPTNRDERIARPASEILDRVADSADTAAVRARTEAGTVATVVLGVLLVTTLIALVVGRSTVRRVKSVNRAARHVADVDLPRMVDALSNPQGRLDSTVPVELEKSGTDEVGELARSFVALHSTLVEVANKQMDILRRGVSDIFVTLARRNGSLVDRQLALIDQLEAKEEDPATLDGYYKLDHLSTRMRRNAESLLVLAGSDSPRMWSESLEMDDVVRAALGEVDEYQRVDVLALEPTKLKGRVVTDLSHLLSELLDNATQFSPPTERVRVTALFDDEGYIITVADSGIGIPEPRMAALNHLLREPPVLGLALEPTLGMYVVARLASRHGIRVRLVPGVPGTTVRITLPRNLLDGGEETEVAGPDEAVVIDADSRREERKSALIPGFATRGSHSRRRHHDPDPAAPRLEPVPNPAPAAPAKPEARPAARGTEPAPRPTPALPPASPSSDPVTAFSRGPLPTRRPTEGRREPAEPQAPAATVRSTAGKPSVVERPGAVTHLKPITDVPPPPSKPAASPATAPPVTKPATAPTASPGTSPTPASSPTAPPTALRPVDATVTVPTRPPSAPVAPSSPSLPTRKPGASFQDETQGEASSAVSERGAQGIRDALDGFKFAKGLGAGRDEGGGPESDDRGEGQ